MFYETGALDIALVHGNAKFGNGGLVWQYVSLFVMFVAYNYATVTGEGINKKKANGIDMVSHFTLPSSLSTKICPRLGMNSCIANGLESRIWHNIRVYARVLCTRQNVLSRPVGSCRK